MSITFRCLKLEDLEDYNNYVLISKFLNALTNEGVVKKVVLCDRYCVMYVNGYPVGLVGLRKLSWFMTEVKHMYIKPTFRGRKLSKILLNHVLQHVQTPIVVAVVKVDNFPAIKTFLSQGFDIVKTFKSRLSGNDVVLLMKYM